MVANFANSTKIANSARKSGQKVARRFRSLTI